MLHELPLGDARLIRPARLFRYRFEHFARRFFIPKGMPGRGEHCVIPIEAAVSGDEQVLAAAERGSRGKLVINLDRLAEIPSVQSVIACTQVEAGRDQPELRELLINDSQGFLPQPELLTHLSGLQSLYAYTMNSDMKLNLDALPAEQMRELAFTRWHVKSIAPLERMTGLVRLKVDLFREPLEAIAGMAGLRFLSVKGPARGWAKLRQCTILEEASFVDVEMANLRRWNTWKSLRTLGLTGRGLKSLAGLEASEQLQKLFLINLGMDDLSPLRDLAGLESLLIRMPAGTLDLSSIGQVRSLRSLEIDESVISDADIIRLANLKALAGSENLEELVLVGVAIEDGDLTPLAALPRLRRVRLGSHIAADVGALRSARPDIAIDYTPPIPRGAVEGERIGRITIHRPASGIQQWSIFESLASALGTETNYAAEKKIQQALKKRDPEAAARVTWDTEAGAIGIYAAREDDIRLVADVINDLAAAAQH